MSGRAASQGGRDHTSHRLVALGLSERRAVWLLYGLAAGSGILAVMVNRLALPSSVALIALFIIALSLLGVYLGQVRVYSEEEVSAARESPLLAFVVGLSYKRRIFEVVLDVVLVLLSSHAARILVAGSLPLTSEQFMQSTAILICVQMTAFLALGSYRGIWRFIGIENLIIYTRAIAVGTVAAYAILWWVMDLRVMSPALFVVDAMVLLITVSGSRVAFRLFRQMFPAPDDPSLTRVLVFGAGDSGEMLVRQLKMCHDLGLSPVAFADDDPLKARKVIHGLRVHGTADGVVEACRAANVKDIVISSTKINSARLDEIVRDCGRAGIGVRLMRIEFEAVSDSSTPVSIAAQPQPNRAAASGGDR
jgi:UDP-GlcNAc:undecaprenyl-phosphate GlcNAc-1-phosphate transferase